MSVQLKISEYIINNKEFILKIHLITLEGTFGKS